MTLNALAVDPNVRWKGGWRYFGSEDVLLAHCCINPERVRRIGITMEEFGHLATCQGLHVTMKRAMASHPTAEEERNQHKYYSVEHFRRDVQTVLQEDPLQQQDSSKTGILIVSFSRAALGQTGDGHFSPLAAYHAETDQVLVLDVARFKYQPYWVKVDDLYAAMSPRDQATQKPRGWYIVHPPTVSASYKGLQITSEDVRPAALVPTVGQGSPCPVNVIKVDFCKANSYKKRDDQRKEK
jgi:glutathione gamma-glutamylcysteinyltransferase